jgi:hypothetical protein
MDNKMAELNKVLIEKFDGTNYKCWCLEIKAHCKQRQDHGMVDGI